MKNMKIIKIAVVFTVFLTLTACSMKKEVNEKEIKDTEISNTEILSPITVEKIVPYDGMEITDWLDEQTVVLAKENSEFEKMSLLENSEFYPRSIYLYHLDTKEYKTLKAQKNMFLGGANLSPDKKNLLYYEYSIGDTAHYMMSMKESETSPVTEDVLGTAMTAEWADADHVIGVSYAGGAYIAETSGKIDEISELEEQLFTVKQSKDKIYYITIDNPSSKLYMLDLVSKEKKNLKVDNAYGVIPSPDGNQILVIQETESTSKLLMADAEGNILRTIAEGTEITGVSWSPDQGRVAFQLSTVVDGVDNSGLYVYDLVTDKSIQIAENSGAAKIRWSPSGKKIAVTELNERAYNSSIIYLK